MSFETEAAKCIENGMDGWLDLLLKIARALDKLGAECETDDPEKL